MAPKERGKGRLKRMRSDEESLSTEHFYAGRRPQLREFINNVGAEMQSIRRTGPSSEYECTSSAVGTPERSSSQGESIYDIDGEAVGIISSSNTLDVRESLPDFPYQESRLHAQRRRASFKGSKTISLTSGGTANAFFTVCDREGWPRGRILAQLDSAAEYCMTPASIATTRFDWVRDEYANSAQSQSVDTRWGNGITPIRRVGECTICVYHYALGKAIKIRSLVVEDGDLASTNFLISWKVIKKEDLLRLVDACNNDLDGVSL